jgi:hypothetical protein
VAKRIDPHRSPASATGGGTLSPPKKDPRGTEPAPKRKRSIWRRLWIWTQVVLAVLIITACVAGYFIYQQGMVYYKRAEAIDLNSSTTSASPRPSSTRTARNWAAFSPRTA